MSVSKKTKQKKKTTTKKKVAKKTKKKAVSAAKKKKITVKKTATKKKKETQKAKTAIYKAKVSEGKKVPDFKIPSTDGEFSLKAFAGKNVVLYFYPKDATPGCTQEGHDFSDLLKKFSKANTVVYGVSRESLASHERFIEKQSYKHHLIADEDEALCSLFGVMKMKKLYGREYRGLDRSTFVIDSERRLSKEWRGVKVKGHAQEVLEYVQGL